MSDIPPSVAMLEEVEALRKKYTEQELTQLASLITGLKVSRIDEDIKLLEQEIVQFKEDCAHYRAWFAHARNNPTMTLTALLNGLESASRPGGYRNN